MRHKGKAERARVKKRRSHCRFRMTEWGRDVPGGRRTVGPLGKRHAKRFHRWDVRKHLVAVRKASQAPSER